jgi:hypothetical protein
MSGTKTADNEGKERAASEPALLRLHEHVSNEITRFRDSQWKVSSVMITFLFALAAVSGREQIGSLIKEDPLLRATLLVLSYVLFGAIAIFLVFTQGRLMRAYDLLNAIEEQLNVDKVVQKFVTPTGREHLPMRLARSLVLVVPLMILAFLATIVSVRIVQGAK